MKASAVFTPGKTPTVTLVQDHLKSKVQAFKDAQEQQLLITISGPSKSGKTVFVKNIVGGENLIPITGAGVNHPDQLWLKVFHAVGTPITFASTSETGSSLAATVGGKAAAGVLIAKGEVSASGTGTSAEKIASTTSQHVDYLQLLIKELAGSDFVLFIDDFHYIAADVQNQVAEQIKEAIDKGVSIVCASVPHHSEDLLRANPDLQGRFMPIDFDYWDNRTLLSIADLGFKELGISLPRSVVELFSGEAAGSPQLMQTICLNACYELNIRESVAKPVDLTPDDKFIDRVCTRSLSTDFSKTVEKLIEGPKTRGKDRLTYRLRDGSNHDVYVLTLLAIAANPPALRFSYTELLGRIRALCEVGKAPTGSSTTGACQQIALLANDGQSRVLIEWDAEREYFVVRDPYFLFYLRWSDSLIDG